MLKVQIIKYGCSVLEPKIYHASDFDIAPENIDSDALYVVQRLKEAGHQAYLVGGSVRDLLTKKRPKDVDISTSALPEEVKNIFKRNCVLIGRRFRLAHLHFGRKILEVSTFRSGEHETELVLQHNEWGTPQEDATRRDFTINGLFYDPEQHKIIDYVGGWEDIHQGILRSIGHAETRFKQDPVRMLRLLKFRARFGFEIEPETFHALLLCRDEIAKSSPARVLEEMLRMLESGASAPFFEAMSQYGLLSLIFPVLDHIIEDQQGHEIYSFLQAADRYTKSRGPGFLDRPTLLACLLFPLVKEELANRYLNQGLMPHFGEISLVSSSIFKDVIATTFTSFPRRLSSSTAFVLASQFRLTPLNGKRSYRTKLIHNKEFKDALRFLRLRALVDPDLEEEYQEWKRVFRQSEHHGERKPHPHSVRPRPVSKPVEPVNIDHSNQMPES